jgi:hypothetical protein
MVFFLARLATPEPPGNAVIAAERRRRQGTPLSLPFIVRRPVGSFKKILAINDYATSIVIFPRQPGISGNRGAALADAAAKWSFPLPEAGAFI